MRLSSEVPDRPDPKMKKGRWSAAFVAEWIM
jgi:hypothetical protein